MPLDGVDFCFQIVVVFDRYFHLRHWVGVKTCVFRALCDLQDSSQVLGWGADRGRGPILSPVLSWGLFILPSLSVLLGCWLDEDTPIIVTSVGGFPLGSEGPQRSILFPQRATTPSLLSSLWLHLIPGSLSFCEEEKCPLTLIHFLGMRRGVLRTSTFRHVAVWVSQTCFVLCGCPLLELCVSFSL